MIRTSSSTAGAGSMQRCAVVQRRTAWSGGIKWLILLAAVMVQVCGSNVWAAPTTAEQAKQVAQAWLSTESNPMGASLGSTVGRVETFTDGQGQPAYYIVYLAPQGFVIVSADDQIEPIVGFLPEGQYDPSTANPLGALVSQDMTGRIAGLRQVQDSKAPMPPVCAAAQTKWNGLLAGAAGALSSPLGMVNSVSDVRVSPLVQSKWDQGTAYTGGPNCYNYYTPSNSICGCVATAMAQLMRYWQYPTGGIGVHSFQIQFNGTPQTASTRGGDGQGGPYSWTQMVLTPSTSITTTQCQAIGALCYDAGVSVNMMYTLNLSGAYMSDSKTALVSTFHYTNAVLGGDESNNIGAPLTTMLNPCLDGGYPCLLGIRGSAGGHAIVADGYGFYGNSLYHHLNMGWNGQDNAWYNLPTIDTSWTTFSIVTSCIYNIFESGNGEIISGRVTDRSGTPVSGATVVAQQTNGSQYTATTNGKGIYAIAHVPSTSNFVVSVAGTYWSPGKSVTTGSSTDGGTVGNVWGVDFTATPAGPPKVQFSNAGYIVNRDNSAALITVSLTGSNPGGMSVQYATSDGTAIDGTDYTGTSGTLAFDAYATQATFSVPLNSSLYDPTSKALTLTLSNPQGTGLTLGTPVTATLTILGSQTPPAVSLTGVRQDEGDSGTNNFDFTVNLTKKSTEAIIIAYKTVDETAIAGKDYTDSSGTVTIPPGNASATISVPVIGNTTYENDKTFLLKITSVTSNNATIKDLSVEGVILNDDPVPTVTIADTSGSAPAIELAVTLSGPSAMPITMRYETADGTALGGAHYTRVSGTLTIQPGETSTKIEVPVRAADMHECDRTFSVTLSFLSGADFSKAYATGTIVCNIPEPSLSIGDPQDLGQFLAFPVQLSAGTDSPTIISYITKDGTAVAGKEYESVSGTLTIPAGQKTTTVTVPVLSRSSTKKDLYVRMSGPGGTLTKLGVIQPETPSSDNNPITPAANILRGMCGQGAGSATLLCCMWLGVMRWCRGSLVIRRRR